MKYQIYKRKSFFRTFSFGNRFHSNFSGIINPLLRKLIRNQNMKKTWEKLTAAKLEGNLKQLQQRVMM